MATSASYGRDVHVVMLTDAPAGPVALVAALAELDCTVTLLAYAALPALPWDADCVLLDGTLGLTTMVEACRSPTLRGLAVPTILVAPSESLAVLKVSWGFDDWLLPDCSRNELATRLRLAAEVWSNGPRDQPAASLFVDPESYTVTVHAKPLNLTYTEFELLWALVSAPRQVWTRAALLRDVWGYQHSPDTRTVDVHIRRLRAKLGPEVSASIQTVRKVGYRFVPDTTPSPPRHALDHGHAMPYAVRAAS